MRLRDSMRNQKKDFVELLARQIERSQGGSSEKPSSREVAQGSTIEYHGLKRRKEARGETRVIRRRILRQIRRSLLSQPAYT
jgi:hypothetical protein